MKGLSIFYQIKIINRYNLKEDHSEECGGMFIKKEKNEMINIFIKDKFISELKR